MKLFAYNKTFASITGFNVTNLSAIQFAVGAVLAFALEIAGGITHEKSYFYIALVVAVLVSMPATLEMYVQIDKEEKVALFENNDSCLISRMKYKGLLEKVKTLKC